MGSQARNGWFVVPGDGLSGSPERRKGCACDNRFVFCAWYEDGIITAITSNESPPLKPGSSQRGLLYDQERSWGLKVSSLMNHEVSTDVVNPRPDGWHPIPGDGKLGDENRREPAGLWLERRPYSAYYSNGLVIAVTGETTQLPVPGKVQRDLLVSCEEVWGLKVSEIMDRSRLAITHSRPSNVAEDLSPQPSHPEASSFMSDFESNKKEPSIGTVAAGSFAALLTAKLISNWLTKNLAKNTIVKKNKSVKKPSAEVSIF